MTSDGAATGISRFHTADLDEARERTCRTFSEHDVRLVGGDRLDFRLDLVTSRRLTVGRMAYGADTTVHGPPMEHCYHVNVPLTGAVTAAQHGRRSSFAGGDAAVVFRPEDPFVVMMSPESRQYHLKLPKDALDAHAAKLTGAQAVSGIDFDLTADLRTEPGRALRAVVGLLYDQFSRPDGLGRFPGACRELESTAMTSVVMAVPSRLTGDLTDIPARTRRARIDEVMHRIDDDPGDQLTTADLAATAGMSLRALQAGFRDVAGTSPTAYLRNARLDRVHAELVTGASVTEAATRWGFYHLGRFAGRYRERFGTLPSAVVREVG